MRGIPNSRWSRAGLLLLLLGLLVLASLSLDGPIDVTAPERRPEDTGVGEPDSQAEVPVRRPERQHSRPPIWIHGLVLDASTARPIAGARVAIRRQSGEMRGGTDASGKWTLSVVPSWWARGETSPWVSDWPTLFVEAEGYIGRRRGLQFTGETDPWRAPTVTLRTIGATVRGRVLDPDGAPIPGAEIRLTGAPGVKTNARGRFGPCSIPTGSVDVRVKAHGWWPGNRRLVVRPGASPETFHLEFVLGPMERVSGIVVDEAGRPVPGVALSDNSLRPARETSDAKGRFTWPLEPGESESLHAAKDGYVDMDLSTKVSRGGENRIVLHRAGEVRGRVLLADGSPAAGFVVHAQFELFDRHSRMTDARGGFVIDRIRLGDLKILVLKHGLVLGRFPATVPGPPGGVTLRLPPLVSMPVTVVDAATEKPVANAGLVGINSNDRAWTGEDGRTHLLHPETGPESADLRIVHPRFHSRSVWTTDLDREGGLVVELTPLTEVQILVVTKGGNPAAGAAVKSRGEWPWSRREDTCDEEGRVLLLLPLDPAFPEIVATHPLHGAGRSPAPKGAGPHHARIVLAPRPSERESPSPVAGVVAGVVTGPGGRPALGHMIYAPEIRLEGRVDGHGRFTLEGFPTGWSGRLEVGIPGCGSIVAHRHATVGEEEVRISVPGRAWLRLPRAEGATEAPETIRLWLLESPDLARGGVLWIESIPHREADRWLYPIPTGPVRVHLRVAGIARTLRLDLSDGEVWDVSRTAPPAPVLTGIVLGPDGEPVPDVWIRDALTHDRIAETDEEGRIRLAEDVPRGFIGPLWATRRPCAPMFTRPVDLVRGDDLRIRLPRAGAVRVEIRNEAGEPRNHRVRRQRAIGPHESWESTGRDGWENFAVVPPGRQRFEVKIRNRLPLIREVEVVEGETVTLRITVPGN